MALYGFIDLFLKRVYEIMKKMRKGKVLKNENDNKKLRNDEVGI